MNLFSPATTLFGVGDTQAKKLTKLGIVTLFDLLYHLPFRYEDRSQVSPVSQLQAGETVTVVGTISDFKNRYLRLRKSIQTAILADASGQLRVSWFNQPFLSRTLHPGTAVALFGKVSLSSGRPTLVSPDYELIQNEKITSEKPDLIHTTRVVPIYPETAGISSKWLRTKIWPLLQKLPDSDPWPTAQGVPSWKKSLTEVHFPAAMSTELLTNNPFRRRLALDELFLLACTAASRRQAWKLVQLTHPFSIDKELVRQFIASLPFTLTASQDHTLGDILADLSQPRPMNRLIEGDVGSGKTVVAAIASYVAHLNGLATLILAPTQILAAQHHQTLSALFQPFGIEVGIVTGSTKSKDKNEKMKIIVGTHALLSANRAYQDVGLVVIDEQHRFGVIQRTLASQLGASPHILTMTATPIPRSLALTLHGDLDLSVLSDVIPGRLPVKTWVVPESKRAASYDWISDQLAGSRSQCFWVCPFIEASESLASVKSATQEFRRLQAVFPSLRLDLLHGKLKPHQKDDVISRFRGGEYHILVTTPVVEVGVDIPAATVMVIEGADRFGLAQLHQLRGRVGRSHLQSFCLLFSSTESGLTRLKLLEKHSSGLQLAEMDLRFRGPGTLYDTAQSGQSEFKVASYTDFDLVDTAKHLAETALPRLNSYPVLKSWLTSSKITHVNPN